MAQHRQETTARRSLLAPLFHLYWFLGVDVGLHLVVQLLSKVARARWITRCFYRSVAPLTIPRRWKVVDKSQRMLTMEHELFRHIEIEVFVERSELLESLQFVRQLLEYSDGAEAAISQETWERLKQHDLASAVSELLGCYTHHYPICIRKVLPDEAIISMTSGRNEPSYAVSVISYHRPQQRDGYIAFAKVLAQTTARLFNARPHWGKVCPIDSQLAAELYPRLPEFRRICKEFDPEGVFRNEWLEEVIFRNP